MLARSSVIGKSVLGSLRAASIAAQPGPNALLHNLPCITTLHAQYSSKPARKIYGRHQEDGGEKYLSDHSEAGDHSGRQQNHIWSKEEIDAELKSLYRHEPKTIVDKITKAVMYGLYHSFNFVTGYKEGAASVKAVEWRLIVLESIAGVPGFVAAGFRHFRSLRLLQRDHGWIATLLEEAENERMHLIVCLNTFKAGMVTKAMVIAAQFTMGPILTLVYLARPQTMHRFVAYLEETACHTYSSVIAQVERPGTELHAGWANMDAPEVAKAYWKLPADAKWVDALKCMFADECHHRDVNHTFAEMNPQDPNPFVLMHKRNALRAHMLTISGQTAWPSIQKEVTEAQEEKK